MWLVLPVVSGGVGGGAQSVGHITSATPSHLPQLDQERFMGSVFSQHHEDIPPCLLAYAVAVGSQLSGQSPVFIGYPASSDHHEVAGPLGSSMSTAMSAVDLCLLEPF